MGVVNKQLRAFCHLGAYGTPSSSQVDALKDVGRYSVNTALTFGVILVPLLGVLLGLSLAIAAGLVKAAVLCAKFRHNVNETEQALREETRLTHHSALEKTCPRIPAGTIPRSHYDVPQDHLSLQSDSNDVHTTHLSKAVMRAAAATALEQHNYCSGSSKLMSRQLAHISAWLDISAKFLFEREGKSEEDKVEKEQEREKRISLAEGKELRREAERVK